MALDPATAKLIAKVVISQITDEEWRKIVDKYKKITKEDYEV